MKETYSTIRIYNWPMKAAIKIIVKLLQGNEADHLICYSKPIEPKLPL